MNIKNFTKRDQFIKKKVAEDIISSVYDFKSGDDIIMGVDDLMQIAKKYSVFNMT